MIRIVFFAILSILGNAFVYSQNGLIAHYPFNGNANDETN